MKWAPALVIVTTVVNFLPTLAFGQAAYIDRSGTIAVGGAARALLPANSNRRGCYVQNPGTTDLWLDDIGGTAVASQPSFKLAAGTTYNCPAGAASRKAFSIINSTTAAASYTAREW